MSAAQKNNRSLRELAQDILANWGEQTPKPLQSALSSMARLEAIDDLRSYEIVAGVRRGLNAWRSSRATHVKRELEVLLAHFRADYM